MNRKGGAFSGVFQFVVNSALITAFVWFLYVMIFGGGGGFKAIWKAGSFIGDLPEWVIVVIVLFFLYLIIGRKK